MALRIASEIFGNTTRGGAAVVAWDSNDMFATRSGDEAPTFYVVTPEYGVGFVKHHFAVSKYSAINIDFCVHQCI